MVDKYSHFWLGIDLGTTSVKVILLDHDGKVVSSESKPTQADVNSDAGECGYEQNPFTIIMVAEDMIKTAASLFKDNIRGIGITGQMHGVMLWSGKNQNKGQLQDAMQSFTPHSNLYTWQDQRCSQEFLDRLPAQSDCHQTLSTGYGCATLFWLAKHRPALIRDHGFTACGTVMDYLVCRLCDLDHPVMSDHLAASFGYFNKTKIEWDGVLRNSADFPYHLLPRIISAGKVVGHTQEIHGLAKGIPVLVAMGDVQCAMQAVLSSPQDAAVNISTSIQMGFAVGKDRKDDIARISPPSISFFPYFGDQELALFAGLNGGNAFYCFAECIAQWIADLGIASNVKASSLLPKLQKLSEDKMTKNSMPSEPVQKPPVFHPVFFGERHDKSMKASVTGIDYVNFSNVGLLFHSLSEGIVDQLYQMVPLEYLVQNDILRLRVSGSVPMNNVAVMTRLRQVYSNDIDQSPVKEKSQMAIEKDRSSSTNRGGGDCFKPKVEVIMDTQGLEAVGSALGAARVAQKYIHNVSR